MVHDDKQSLRNLENYFTDSILYQEEDEIGTSSNNGYKADSEPKDDDDIDVGDQNSRSDLW